MHDQYLAELKLHSIPGALRVIPSIQGVQDCPGLPLGVTGISGGLTLDVFNNVLSKLRQALRAA